MILLESRTKKFYHKSIDRFCFIAPTKSVTQNIRGVTERLLRAAQRMLESRIRLSEQCLRTIVQQVTPRLPATMVTALAIIKPKKHQRLADPLLQSGVVTRNNRV